MTQRRIGLSLLVACVTLFSCGGMESPMDGGTGGGGASTGGGGGATGGGGGATGGGGGATGGGGGATGGGGGATGGGGGATGGGGGAANLPPTVSATITSSVAAPYAGQLTTLSITATDPESNPLTITWSQSAPAAMGTFEPSGTMTNIGWFSPEVTTNTAFTIEVSVSDGTNAPVTRTLMLTVRAPKFTEVWGSILNTRCSGCHGFAGGSAATSYSSIVNVNHGAGAGCSNTGITKRIVPGDKGNSLILRKVQGTQPAGCGAKMPQGGTLADNQLVSLSAWIAAGAPND